MWRYFTVKKTMRYIDMLPDLVYAYNHTVHRSIKTKPVLVNSATEDKYGMYCMIVILMIYSLLSISLR